MPDCRDKSDEEECRLLVLEKGYNKNIPPIASIKPKVEVNISITLMKIVEIEERDHSIHLQFQITLEWKETERVRYHNLKQDVSLNALTDEDLGKLWLPLIIFDNTDQKDSTRLGEYGNGEWTTTVTVTREGNFTRSEVEVVDEIEVFKGSANKLTMNQTYTREFQCKYQLQRYPFDTQVCRTSTLFCFSKMRFPAVIWTMTMPQECKIKMATASLASATVELNRGQVLNCAQFLFWNQCQFRC